MKAKDSYLDAGIVPPDAVALIVRADGSVQMMIPQGDDEWHETQTALAQLGTRFMMDSAWVDELAEELRRNAS